MKEITRNQVFIGPLLKRYEILFRELYRFRSALHFPIAEIFFCKPYIFFFLIVIQYYFY